MIRALRFASKLNFTIEEATYEGIKEKRKMMLHAAPARIYEEIQKLFFCGNAVKLFDYLENTGLLEVVFPEFSRFIEDNANEHDWTVRIMRQFDKWTNAGAHIAPPVLFALMFGPYYESLAAKIGGGDIRQKMRDVAAMHLGGMRERIVVPKTVKESVGYIMADQSKLTGSRKNRRKLPRQRGFGEAFLYFKLRSRHTGEHGEDVEYWEQCLQK
jgi:poly(A) polymerase